MAEYEAGGGYQSARKALTSLTPEAVRDEVRKAALRGRGGAGFPAGAKWGFVPQDGAGPRYLCVNADEGEPGTFKDRRILTRTPHLLLEGIIIASYAVGVHTAFVYIRGEYEMIARRLEAAVAEAYACGCLGRRVLGSEFGLDVLVHRGAGAYVCGEETALLESLEGKRGWPRLKPPFPATIGLFRQPTVIQNVETLANLPRLMADGAAAFLALGRPKDGGTRLFGVSGTVVRPGLYERAVGTPLREIIFEDAGGLPPGRRLKAVIPGGLSSPLLLPDEINVAMDVDSLAAAGSMLGSAGIIVIADDTPIVTVLDRMASFYAHESCGQCTPCRLGTSWLAKIASRLAKGEGRPGDPAEIERVAGLVRGRTLCPLGDAAALPILALTRKFRTELDAAVAHPRPPEAPR
ncbi:MAG: NADH-quinone oxidoreductase subunit NuoF [Candidatus Aminicenantes bacterium]|nr:NADH-quinone oxidoreductase subunit NuoF [Candidatus Aminicenantes bacterium]